MSIKRKVSEKIRKFNYSREQTNSVLWGCK